MPVCANAAPVKVSCAWARASLPHQDSSVAYMTLNSVAGDVLDGVETEAAGMAMLHQTSTRGGMSDMQDIDSLTLPAGRDVALAPGGTHIMLMDLKNRLLPGQSLKLALHFKRAGEVRLAVPVLAATAAGPCP